MEKRIWHQNYVDGVTPDFDFEKLTLPEFLSHTAERYPDLTALDFMGLEISFHQLNQMVNRFANALHELGIGPGEHVALLMPNIPQMVISYFAVWRIGCVPVPNNPLYTDTELKHQFNNSEATHLIVMDALEPRMTELKRETGLKTIISTKADDMMRVAGNYAAPHQPLGECLVDLEKGQTVQFLDLLCGGSENFKPVENRMSDLALIPYTGGTTGVAKGAMLTHANVSCATQMLSQWLVGTINGQETELAIFPFFHLAGFMGVMCICVCNAWRNVLVPRPEPQTVVDMTLKYKPTIFLAVPTIYTGILADERFRNADLSHIKVFFSGAAPLSLDTIRDLNSLVDAPIVEGYAMTEATAMLTQTPCGGRLKPGSVGVPVQETDLRIVDLDTGVTEMPVGEPGEIVVKGPQMLSGYYRMPDETKDAFRDGWFYTGDIGYQDEEGYLFIVDRKKDMIIAGGYNIYPREVEEVLMQHPDIFETCVIGVGDDYRGETVKAFVVPKTGKTVTEEDLDPFCRSHLAAYKVPRIYQFVTELPKSNVGKILKKGLR